LGEVHIFKAQYRSDDHRRELKQIGKKEEEREDISSLW
jgi:hypothetical protein